MTVTQIASKFGRSLKTISAQKSSAYRKLGIESDVQLFNMREHVVAVGGAQE
jgi:two-component system capsular synthesis response regulator RcsB